MCKSLQVDLAELMALLQTGDRARIAGKLDELQRDYFKYSKIAKQMIDIFTSAACANLAKP